MSLPDVIAQVAISAGGSFVGIAVWEHWHLEDLWAARKHRIEVKRAQRRKHRLFQARVNIREQAITRPLPCSVCGSKDRNCQGSLTSECDGW